MSSTRLRAGPAMVAAITTLAATGVSLAVVFFTGPPHPPSAPTPPRTHVYTPPRTLPLSSKLPIIPDANFEQDPDVGPQCDYGPLWECIINGNGGCEILEKELRECVARSRNS